MDLRRWTPFTFVAPDRYVGRDDRWDAFDIEEWSASEYDWTQDPWNGLSDFAKRPDECVDAGRGDCEDYALVALSWAFANDRDGIGIGFCWDLPWPWPRHVIAFDDERVYSSGEITEESVGEWKADSKYAFVLKRRVSDPS
ncbi:hypothetical protein C471_13506 [Halorubrum saccharovorum DSM 1137]|uniref:Transglutaminase-like domain-containing protein n=1 Tax=Halorubrum saccharovorum DSM 1137 TaxID=1227484 RepID=M0DQY4_9EURY|nr:hypothetical protein [Halorubrum saccharovorum]ELZ37082.1 hypothetical protein C471_13506 [Halorubrum saccharovorum DSM 1137]